MRKLGNDHEADLFSSLELKSRATGELIGKGHFLERQFADIYEFYNEYGRNFARPPLILLAFFLIFFSYFYLYGMVDFVEVKNKAILIWIKEISQNSSGEKKYIWASVLQSVFNTLGPLGWVYQYDGIQYVNIGGAILGFTQKLFCTIIWFLWILQIRRRFKLS